MSELDAHEFHIICQTHWDREWRLSFQQTRVMLVDFMDDLLDLLENDPDYRHYHLDGQAILLEDYLDIRPENRQRLSTLIAEGRILVGPWYTLPEENLVDGECLIRNLLVGHGFARDLGGVMKVGFTPTSYGQVPQMPQIYMGFGIDSILFHRGIPSSQVDLEYIWEGSDGTRILGIRPSLGGRFNFSTLVVNRVLNPENGDDPPYSAVSDRELHHSCSLKDEYSVNGDGMYYSEAIPTEWNKDTLRKALVRLRELTSTGATTRFLLCGEGHDLMAPNPVLPKIVAAANTMLGKDRFVISSLPGYITRIRTYAGNLKLIKGEMRATQKDESGARLYAGTLSSRMYLKQMNRRAEALLIKWAEPFSSLSWMLGDPYPKALLQRAWKYLLANHAHDSISGTGMDQVHNDMVWRFTQCEQIAGELTRKALSRITARVRADGAQEGDPLITVFNPLPFERDDIIDIAVDLPNTSSHHLRIWDPAGRPVAFHESRRMRTTHTVQQTHGFPHRFYAEQHRVSFLAESVPAVGCKTYRIEMCDGPGGCDCLDIPDEVRICGENQMENRHLRVRINSDGTLCILDKTTGQCYDRLNAFEDCGEIGDSYDHTKPRFGTVVTTSEACASIQCHNSGPFAASFEVKPTLSVSEAVSADKTRRSSKHRSLDILSTVTLKMNARRVDIVTRINNRVKDHRLRVLFPTGIRTDKVWVHGQFELLSRPIAIPDGAGWIEPPCSTQPQLDFVDLNDDAVGLAVINQGLPEYEVFEDADRTVALTLLRCFTHKTRSTQTDDPQQVGTQCPGVHEFRYALYPHTGDTIKGEVFTEAQLHNHDSKVIQSWCRRADNPGRLQLPMETSGLAVVPPELILSCMKQSEDGEHLVIRLFNPTSQRVEGQVRLHGEITRAAHLDLDENVALVCPVLDGRTVPVMLEPKQIMTLGLTLALSGDRPA
jgi:mannosylglycerate hydrolase